MSARWREVRSYVGEQRGAPLRGKSPAFENTGSAHLQNEISLETSIPAASLESILCTEELLNRPSRPPDHKVENSALVALTSALADSPQTILQTLADKVLEVLQADSAGLSLLTKDEKRFYWAAIAGAWGPRFVNGEGRMKVVTCSEVECIADMGFRIQVGIGRPSLFCCCRLGKIDAPGVHRSKFD